MDRAANEAQAAAEIAVDAVLEVAAGQDKVRDRVKLRVKVQVTEGPERGKLRVKDRATADLVRDRQQGPVKIKVREIKIIPIVRVLEIKADVAHKVRAETMTPDDPVHPRAEGPDAQAVEFSLRTKCW